MPSLLVTNDFPPKLGGIQTYLHELWRRLPPGETTVLTTPYGGDRAFDRAQPFRVERTTEPVLLPRPAVRRRVDALAREVGADVVFLDPMLPLGWIGPELRAAPSAVVVHGAEVTVPGRLPGTRRAAGRVLRATRAVVAAGRYPAREARRAAGGPLPGIVVPPGVDVDRFRPLAAPGPPRGSDRPAAPAEDPRRAARAAFGLDPDRPLVVSVSRLVPRKGFDVVIDAVAGLSRDVQLAIAGAGRDRGRLAARARRRGVESRVRFLGRVSDDALPALYACADVFAMACRERWLGLEAEGFGIVFLEAAACGVPSVAGRSGGSHEAVEDGVTGLVVPPRDAEAVRDALDALLRDDARRRAMGDAARRRAVERCSYDVLVRPLAALARGDWSALAPIGED